MYVFPLKPIESMTSVSPSHFATEVRLSVRKARYILGGRRLGRRRSRYQKKDSNDYKSDGDQTTEADFHLKISFRKSGADVSRNGENFVNFVPFSGHSPLHFGNP